MHINTKRIAGIYSAWCLLWLSVALIWPGEASIGAHLWLAFTGMPSALFSLWLPNATFFAVFTAAALGLAQWLLVAESFARFDAWRERRMLAQQGAQADRPASGGPSA